MNRTGLIQGLIFILIVSLAVAGVCACEAGEVADDDTSDHANGLYVSGSGDVSHVSGYSNSFGDAPHVETLALHI